MHVAVHGAIVAPTITDKARGYSCGNDHFMLSSSDVDDIHQSQL